MAEFLITNSKPNHRPTQTMTGRPPFGQKTFEPQITQITADGLMNDTYCIISDRPVYVSLRPGTTDRK